MGIFDLFSNIITNINDYFRWVITTSDYFSMSHAIRQINDRTNNEEHAQRLIRALELVKEHQSISKAKQSLHGEALATFNKLLQDLDGMNINPVTIPDEFNINFVQNLMDAQFNGIRR